MTAGPFLTAVHFVIPHQMAFVILFLVLLATVISEERHVSSSPNLPETRLTVSHHVST
jgi:Na+-transporting methylmalonyl-CoA/oxaloacetate decarboxylase gamma subunit